MEYPGKERFILTKAYEVAYALFRLAAQMPEKDFAEPLRAAGTAMLAGAAAEDYAAAGRSLRVVECLVKFGGDVGTIGTQNVEVMMREIYALDAAIAERKTAAKTDEVNVAEIFSKPEPVEHTEPNTEPDEEPTPAPVVMSREEPAMPQASNDSAIRQSSILQRIRQSGSCRLRDIQAMFPETSERTLRYDLQTLVEQGLVEKIGNAGPLVFYRSARAARRAEQEVSAAGQGARFQ